MSTQDIRLIKYIFLDVVAYTKRTIEAQCYIIEALNRAVKGIINRYHLEEASLVYIPTGDGMCIALIDTSLPYDIHITIAKEILRRIHVNNSRVKDKWKRFEVRVGINQCDDNIVTDINCRSNVTGAGINNARRIMDLADASQILVSNAVYENLHPRKKYHDAFSQEFTKEAKHGLIFKMHQLIKPHADGLDVNPPSSLVSPPKPPEPEPKLKKLVAYYFAHAIKLKHFTITKAESGQNNYALMLLLYYLAKDSLEASQTRPFTTPIEYMPETKTGDIIEQFELFMNLPFHVCSDLACLALDSEIGSEFNRYFDDTYYRITINKVGKDKFKVEWPAIWDEFGLGQQES